MHNINDFLPGIIWISKHTFEKWLVIGLFIEQSTENFRITYFSTRYNVVLSEYFDLNNCDIFDWVFPL
jgi:hypothetical protein